MAKKLNSKKGLSAIITAVILIALSMAAVVLLWVFVGNMVKKQISSSESCFGNYNKIKLNEQYTCYERVSATNYSLRFSLSMGDIQVDKVVVSVSAASAVKSYELTNIGQNISGLVTYPAGIRNTSLPKKNEGLSYKAMGFAAIMDSIEIAPVIGGNMCDVSDTITGIEDCALMT